MAEFVLDFGGVLRNAPPLVQKRVAAFHLKLQSRGLIGAAAYQFDSVVEALDLAREYGFEFGEYVQRKRGMFDAESGFFVGFFYRDRWDGDHHYFAKRYCGCLEDLR